MTSETQIQTRREAQDHAPLLERAFEIETVEGSWSLEADQGAVPEWLCGTYYLNGPSHFPSEGPVQYRHWLDGDGAVTRLYFEGGKVEFTQRFVDSRKRSDEREAGQLLYRGFGTSFEGDQLKRGIGLESPVNVSAYLFGDRLLAFGEQGLPWELDPVTLETRGEYDFGGRLNAISPLSAHPGFDETGREMYNFGISFSARQPSLTLYRFRDDGELIFRRRHPLPYPCSTHDFVLSGRYVVFFLSPHLLDVGAMMRGGASVNEALTWQPERGSTLMIFDRESGDKKAEIRLGDVEVSDSDSALSRPRESGARGVRALQSHGAGYCLHLINAFERDSLLTVDLVELERPVYDQYEPLPELFVDAPAGGPRRFEIDVEAGRVLGKSAIDYELCPDFPAIDPRYAHGPYDELWLLGITATGRPGRKFFDQLAHLDWRQQARHGAGADADTWTAARHCYLGGEPVFLGHPEDPSRGCIVVQHLDAEKLESSFLLFDAFDVAAGPIARLPLEHPMPLGFHASYYPA